MECDAAHIQAAIEDSFSMSLFLVVCLQRNGEGCPFFYWKAEYIEYVEQLAKKRSLKNVGATDCDVETEKLVALTSKKEQEGSGTRSIVSKDVRSLVKNCKELG